MLPANFSGKTLSDGRGFNSSVYNWIIFNSTNASLQNETVTETPLPPGGLPGKSYPPLRESETITAVVFFCMLVGVIVVGNLLILVSFIINKKLRTTTNTFIASLAAADLIVGAVSVPLWCLFLLIPQNAFPSIDTFRILYSVWVKLDIFAGVSSVNHLTAISIERAYAMLFPLRHRRIRKKWIILCIVIAWTMSAAIAALHYLEMANRFTYVFIVTIGFYFFPLLVILASYAVIFKVARSSIVQHGRRTVKKDLKIAITIALVVGVFVISWLPFHVMNIVLVACINTQCLFDIARVIIVIKAGHYSNSAVNAIIYGFRNKEFSRTFKRIFLILLCKNVPTAYYQDNRSTMARTNPTILVPRRNILSREEDLRDSYIKAISKGVPKSKSKKNILKKANKNFRSDVMMNYISSSSQFEESGI